MNRRNVFGRVPFTSEPEIPEMGYLQPRPQSPGDEVEVKVTGRLEDLRALTRLNSHKLATALISKAFRYEDKVRNQ